MVCKIDMKKMKDRKKYCALNRREKFPQGVVGVFCHNLGERKRREIDPKLICAKRNNSEHRAIR